MPTNLCKLQFNLPSHRKTLWSRGVSTAFGQSQCTLQCGIFSSEGSKGRNYGSGCTLPLKVCQEVGDMATH